MQERKKPQRQCIACRACRDKQDLIRVVKTKEGEIMLDRTGRKNGRGAYLCANEECLKKAWKRRSLLKNTEVMFRIFLNHNIKLPIRMMYFFHYVTLQREKKTIKW